MPQEKITFIEGNKDILLTVIHNKVVKTSTRPIKMYVSEEKGIMEIAKEINKRTGVGVLINNTSIDLNSEEIILDNKELLNEFKRIINRVNPFTIIDLHGMSNKGSMFNNSIDKGAVLSRAYVDKKSKGRRPDVDIGFRRKASSNFCTSRGETVIRLAKCLSFQGLVTDIESVYPGGSFIGNIASVDRDTIALEIANRIRKTKKNRKKVIDGICRFISLMRGEKVAETPQDNTKKIQEKKPEKLLKPSIMELREDN